jgi:acetate---CoA ligase (ADP-forming)
MPVSSVLTTAESRTSRGMGAGASPNHHKEPVRHHAAQRVQRADPDLPGLAIALITTGGHTGCPLVTAEDLGIHISGWVHCDDDHGPSFAETVESFAHADGIGAIAACIDRIDDGRMFTAAAAAAASRGIPLVILATGTDRTAEAAMRQSGVIRADGFDQLLDYAQTLARFPRPAQRPGFVRVAADSSGAAAHLADLAVRSGLEVDEAGDCHDIAELAARPGAGMLLYAVTETGSSAERTAKALVEAGKTGTMPICVVWCSSGGNESGYRTVLQGSSDVATFRTLTNAVGAARAYYDHCDFRFRIPVQSEDNAMAGAKARQILLGSVTRPSGGSRAQPPADTKGLSESQTHQLLRAYGIRTPREQLVTSAAWAVRAAATIGYPVVMKASVKGLPSSSAAGLTRKNVTSASQVRENFKELMDAAGAAGFGAPDGVLIGQQVEGGVDTMIGIRRDERFGPVVVVGVGGAYAETLGDVATRVAPFDAHEARRMLEELHCLPLLTGANADLDALADTIFRVQRMALDLGDVLESFDIAPLAVLRRGSGTVALDASAVLATR